MQQPEADATMQDDESNWEDIQDPNIPMDSEITLTTRVFWSVCIVLLPISGRHRD